MSNLTQLGLDNDQKLILAVYSLYTDEAKNTYLQYTAACAIIYYLTRKHFFDYNLNENIQYDYMGSENYIWEAKKFWKDMNILRSMGYLKRSRILNKKYREINLHQCTATGVSYLNSIESDLKKDFFGLKNTLVCRKGHLLELKFGKYFPYLICTKHHNTFRNYFWDVYNTYRNSLASIHLDGFLKSEIEEEKYSWNIDQNAKPFFI